MNKDEALEIARLINKYVLINYPLVAFVSFKIKKDLDDKIYIVEIQ